MDGQAAGLRSGRGRSSIESLSGCLQVNELSPAWYSQVVVTNASGLNVSSAVVLLVESDGNSTLIQTINAIAEAKLNLRRTPFDSQRLEAVFEVFGFDANDVTLVAEQMFSFRQGLDGISALVRNQLLRGLRNRRSDRRSGAYHLTLRTVCEEITASLSRFSQPNLRVLKGYIDSWHTESSCHKLRFRQLADRPERRFVWSGLQIQPQFVVTTKPWAAFSARSRFRTRPATEPSGVLHRLRQERRCRDCSWWC